MNIQEKIAVWLFGTNTDKDLDVHETIVIQKFDLANPVINQGFHTQINNPNTLTDVSVQTVAILDCGHQYRGSINICSCLKSSCAACSQDIRHCSVCNAPLICRNCRTFSHISKKWYCRKHRHFWILGR
jgi:hypothetical protein